MRKMLTYAAVLVLIAVAGLAAWVRLAPFDPAVWHEALPTDTRALEGDCAAGVQQGAKGAVAACILPMPPQEVLARLDAIALATPRTRRLAGSPEEGRITWETRSALWGFPDYTTAQAGASGTGARLDIRARQRFGTEDWGVNAGRLRDWLAKLDQPG